MLRSPCAIAVACVVLSLPARLSAQTVLDTPGGTIEFVGLDRWTVAGLDDSLQKYAHYSLMSQGAHACGAVLRYKLHFPDAASILLSRTKAGGHPYWLVTLTEPQDSDRVHYRPMPLDTAGGRPDWAAMREVVKAHYWALATYITTYTDSGVPVMPVGADTAGLGAVRAFYAGHRLAQDERDALMALQSDSNQYDRTIAVGLTLAFSGDDRVWHALSQTLVESDGGVKFRAVDALANMVQAGHRPHDFASVSDGLRAVLDGTSQFVFPSVMSLLLQFKPDTSMAEPLLHGGGHMLLAYAGVQYAPLRGEALTLLRALSGKDLGPDVASWRAWVASLTRAVRDARRGTPVVTWRFSSCCTEIRPGPVSSRAAGPDHGTWVPLHQPRTSAVRDHHRDGATEHCRITVGNCPSQRAKPL